MSGDTERKTFAYRVNGRMTAPFPPDVESSHGEFSRAPTNRAVTAATLLGHMVFVIVVRSAGSYIRSAKVPATACLKKETLRMALRDIDHRHLCWTTFEAVVGQELQRQPLNGLIWQNETLMLSELCWRARVLEMQRAGHSEIQFELRIQVARPCTPSSTANVKRKRKAGSLGFTSRTKFDELYDVSDRSDDGDRKRFKDKGETNRDSTPSSLESGVATPPPSATPPLQTTSLTTRPAPHPTDSAASPGDPPAATRITAPTPSGTNVEDRNVEQGARHAGEGGEQKKQDDPAPPSQPDRGNKAEYLEPEPPADQLGDGNENLDREEEKLDEGDEEIDEAEDAYEEIDFDLENSNPDDVVQAGNDADAFNTWAKSARDTKAIEHFNEANMAELARFFLMEVVELKYKVRENRQEGETEYVLSKKKLPGFLRDPYCYQLYGAFKAMLLKNSKTKGAIIAEEMGLGKTMEALILIWIQRLKNMNAVSIFKWRRTGEGTEHLPEEKKDPDAKCPSQAKLPILCGCVKNSPTATFEVQRGINIVIVPGKLVPNWVNEWRETWDPNFFKVLKLDLWVGHRERSLQDLVPTAEEVKKYWVDNEMGKPDMDAQCITFLTTPDSFEGHVQKKFTETRRYLEVPEGKKRAVCNIDVFNRLVAGLAIVDEYHERKRASTGLIQLLISMKKVNPDMGVVGLSGTPWNRTPGDLKGIFQAMATGSETIWLADPRLRFGMQEGMKKIVSAFETSTRGTGMINISAALVERIEELANLQEATTIGRRSESLWFGVPIVQLPARHVYKPDFGFPEQLMSGLIERERTLQKSVNQSSTAKTTLGQKNFQYFTKSWQLRAIATVPGLVGLLAREVELDATWKQFHHVKKWLLVSDNPYYREIETFKMNSPKLNFCVRKAKDLSSMRWRVTKDQAARDVHEKLVIVGHNPVVCAIVAKMLKREFFHKGNVWEKHRKVMFVHGAMSLGQRQDIVDAFQQREGSKADLECDIIIGPVSLLGTGVNLTRARKIIILDIEWLATATQQAGFRIHRLGQLNETYIWILRCSKVEIDRKMHDVQAKRGALMDKASRTEEEAKRTKHEQQKEEEWDLEEGI